MEGGTATPGDGSSRVAPKAEAPMFSAARGVSVGLSRPSSAPGLLCNLRLATSLFLSKTGTVMTVTPKGGRL